MDARFSGEAAFAYGRRARRLIPDFEGLHAWVLQEVSDARSLLSVGCGDGEELSRSSAPRRVGVDPSADMVQAARKRLGASCEIIAGDIEDVKETFEAVTAILVGHFIPYEKRDAFYGSLRSRCEGTLVIAEITAPVDPEKWIEWMITNGTEPEKARSAVSVALREMMPLTQGELLSAIERQGFQLSERRWEGAPSVAFSFLTE